MGEPLTTAPGTTGTLGVFGYLPGQSDFVRVRAAGREVRRLEDWLEKGLHRVRWEMGGGFTVAYPRLYHRFVFRPDNSEQTLVGVLCASMDSHQRPFPFVAFDLIPTALWDHDPVALLGHSETFFAALEQLLRNVARTSHIGQVHGQVLATEGLLGRAADSSVAQATSADQEARYDNFLHETVCGDLGVAGLCAGLSLCHQLIELLGDLQDPRFLRQALELPLGRPAFARELELRFYLAFCRALLLRRCPTLTLFWQSGDTAPGSLFASFREPTFDLFSALLRPIVPSRGVYLPGAPTTGVPRLRPLPGLTEHTALHLLLESVLAPGVEATQHRGRKVG